MSDLLLCELHAHTTWSDGYLTLSELVDLYGRNHFDVLCITDHTVRLDDPMPSAVDSWTWPAYAVAIRTEAQRALSEYGLIVIPGLEFSDNHEDPDRSAHALALGLDHHVSLDAGLVPALEAANEQGAVIVAAHPYSGLDVTPLRPTRRIWRERDALRGLIHRYRALQPPRDLRLDRRGRPTSGRHRRRPPRGAPRLVEDARSVREGSSCGHRPPAVAGTRPAHSLRARTHERAADRRLTPDCHRPRNPVTGP